MTEKQAYQREYRAKHKEKLRLRQREWYKDPVNKLKHADYQRAWRAKNPAKAKQTKEEAYAKHMAKPVFQWEITLTSRMKQYVLARTECEAINKLSSWTNGRGEILSIRQYCVMPSRKTYT